MPDKIKSCFLPFPLSANMAFLSRLSLFAILLTTLLACVNAEDRQSATATIHRFALRSSVHDDSNVTDAQRYAKWLMQRKPTRRSTYFSALIAFLEL